MFTKLGYYLVETLNTNILTVSNCVCNLHPELNFGYVGRDKEQVQHEYFKRLALSNEEQKAYQIEIELLHRKNKIFVDKRFQCIEDAKKIYQMYFRNLKQIHLISISIESSNLPLLSEEMELPKIQEVSDHEKGRFIGYDILGWDIAGYHTYLCNALEQMIMEKYKLKRNDYGLIINSYDEVVKFAELIKGEGEPVEWLPYRMEQYILDR